MDSFIDLCFFLFLFAAVAIFLMTIADIIATKKIFPRFTKWWRKHIVDQYPYNDDKF
jgi:hypothetical protein